MFRPLLLLLALLATARAVDPRALTATAASPRDPDQTAALTISRLEASVEVQGVLVRTDVLLTLALDPAAGTRMEGRLVFGLPAGCEVTGAALDIGETMRPASLTFPETAATAYASVVSRLLDPCLVTLLPDGRVSVQVFPVTVDAPRKLRLEFAQVLPPGESWRFPLTFAEPVRHAVLSGGAESGEFAGAFAGGAEWSLPGKPEISADPWMAYPDGNGRYTWQGLVPAVPAIRPPQHVLIVADASAGQGQRAREAERGFLARLLAGMGTGRVTLAVFSTALHSRTDYPVVDGKCEALLTALDALVCDGVPRPGAVDLADVPADLTVVISALTSPMGGGAVPRLPAAAPVLVMDSVSSSPSAVSRHLAEGTGGAAFDPREPGDPVLYQRLRIDPAEYPDFRADRLASGHWLVTGSFPDGFSGHAAAGSLPAIVFGRDKAAGEMAAHYAGRKRLRERIDSETDTRSQALLSQARMSPVLTERTAFVVLEAARDYQRFGIPLPPGLEPEPGYAGTIGEVSAGDADIVQKALLRPAGTVGEPDAWWQRLTGAKAEVMSGQERNLHTFRRWRDFLSECGLKGNPEWEGLVSAWATAKEELPRLAAEFPKSDPDAAVGLIRKAREHQVARMHVVEVSDPELIMDVLFRSSSGGSGSFTDPFGGVGSGFGAEYLARSWTGPGSGFGPGGGGFRSTAFGSPATPTPASTHRPIPDIVEPAERLLAEGKREEAIRVLSNLADGPVPDHGRLRLLAWTLTKWGESALALEVMQETGRRFGLTATTERDIGLAALAAGDRPLATGHLSRAAGGVARRESRALSDVGGAELRIVLECADPSADADLEIDGPDFARASWRAPLPAFGGALSVDGTGFTPEDFVLVSIPAPLQIRIRLRCDHPAPVRVTVFRRWTWPDQQQEVYLFPQCPPGVTEVALVQP